MLRSSGDGEATTSSTSPIDPCTGDLRFTPNCLCKLERRANLYACLLCGRIATDVDIDTDDSDSESSDLESPESPHTNPNLPPLTSWAESPPNTMPRAPVRPHADTTGIMSHSSNDLRGACFNSSGSLRSNAEDYRSFMTINRLHFMLISDPGPLDPSVESILHRKILYTDDCCQRTCAIILDFSLDITGPVRKDISGGAISVDIRTTTGLNPQKDSLTRLIAVYQPPNLDTVAYSSIAQLTKRLPIPRPFNPSINGTLRGSSLRNEAHRIRAVVRTWRDIPGAEHRCWRRPERICLWTNRSKNCNSEMA